MQRDCYARFNTEFTFLDRIQIWDPPRPSGPGLSIHEGITWPGVERGMACVLVSDTWATCRGSIPGCFCLSLSSSHLRVGEGARSEQSSCLTSLKSRKGGMFWRCWTQQGKPSSTSGAWIRDGKQKMEHGGNGNWIAGNASAGLMGYLRVPSLCGRASLFTPGGQLPRDLSSTLHPFECFMDSYLSENTDLFVQCLTAFQELLNQEQRHFTFSSYWASQFNFLQKF